MELIPNTVSVHFGPPPAVQPLDVMGSPTSWWSYQIQNDVIVQVRTDASPWRLRQIQRAVSEIAARLAQPTSEEDGHENKR